MADSILIVGAGNMGAALARGFNASDEMKSLRIRVYDIHPERLESLCQATGSKPVASLGEEVTDDAVIFCIKPQDLVAATAALKGRLPSTTLVITILAGVMMEDLSTALAFDGAVVRAMPNIAATIGAAATGMCHNDKLTKAQIALAERIFGAIGFADWTKESLLDAVTGLSGSGPAYIYMVIESLTDGGVKMGIPRVLAAKLATQTVLGSAMLVQSTGSHPAILREQVTTPGGTTISAIHELEDRGLRAMLISAVETATRRSAYLRTKKE